MTISMRGIDEMREMVGKKIGPSEWREVTQDDINAFAELSGDHQWIHVDTDRAKAESHYGTTIAHGNLTLSLIDGLRAQLTHMDGFRMGVNYGWNKVRFPAPVPSGSRIRAWQELVSEEDVGNGWHQVVVRFTVEVEGGEKPACVADSVARLLV